MEEARAVFSREFDRTRRLLRRSPSSFKGKTVLVVLDSDHTMKHVREELRLYSGLVSAGSYIVVEDTHYDSVPTHPERGPGPMSAVNAFLREGGSELFEQDITREAMVMTFNPGGWLMRKVE